MNICAEWWTCKGCEYRVLTKDHNGKPLKKAPYNCPSCGHRCSKDCVKQHGPGTGPAAPDRR